MRSTAASSDPVGIGRIIKVHDVSKAYAGRNVVDAVPSIVRRRLDRAAPRMCG
jgi:hypothetical protein